MIEKIYSIAVSNFNNKWYNKTGEEWYNCVVNLPLKQKVVYLVVVLHNQVVNGGFHQYYVNRYGQFCEDTVSCLNLIGANKKAKVLKKSIEVVNYEKLSMKDFRKAIMSKSLKKLIVEDDLFEPLEKLDLEYYNSKDDIVYLLDKFLK